MFLSAVVSVYPSAGIAHGDPNLLDEKIATISVTSADKSAPLTGTFTLPLPERAVELVWHVQSQQNKESITFAVSENGTTRATNLKDGAKTRLLKGKVFYIESVAGTDQPFLIEVYAHIVRWPKG